MKTVYNLNKWQYKGYRKLLNIRHLNMKVKKMSKRRVKLQKYIIYKGFRKVLKIKHEKRNTNGTIQGVQRR